MSELADAYTQMVHQQQYERKMGVMLFNLGRLSGLMVQATSADSAQTFTAAIGNLRETIRREVEAEVSWRRTLRRKYTP